MRRVILCIVIVSSLTSSRPVLASTSNTKVRSAEARQNVFDDAIVTTIINELRVKVADSEATLEEARHRYRAIEHLCQRCGCPVDLESARQVVKEWELQIFMRQARLAYWLSQMK